jgi:hypothetical protein
MQASKCPKERPSPPENILKFNVPVGEYLSLGHLLRTWPVSYFGKNYLTVFPQTWDLCMWYSVMRFGK